MRKALGSDVAAALKAQFDRVGAGDYVALLAYVERDAAAIEALTALRTMIRDKKHVATCVGFGPAVSCIRRGRRTRAGPTPAWCCRSPRIITMSWRCRGRAMIFATVLAAQARGDFDVLAERGRRAVRVHLGSDVAAGLKQLSEMVGAAL